jgi:purine-nucleoside phosphorylase
MSTPHIAAKEGEIASRILLPGDPLRAKFIAENFLENVHCYNTIRNMLGFTGTYKGKEVSVQGTGMGQPSLSIYVNELVQFYGVKKLIRTGTCGAFSDDLDIKDMVIVQAAATDSGMLPSRFGSISYPATANFELLCSAVEAAKKLGYDYKVGTTFSSDQFYDEKIMDKYALLAKYGVGCCEMECAELFTIAARYGAQSLGILTVSDSILKNKACTPQEREQTFTHMMEVALEAI